MVGDEDIQNRLVVDEDDLQPGGVVGVSNGRGRPGRGGVLNQ